MLMAFFWWWYTEGWQRQVKAVENRLLGVIDTFSMDLILRTMFAPFRQISAGSVSGPIGVQLRAFVDRLVSRGIGAMVRTIVLLTGVVVISLSAFVGVVFLLLWPVLPVLPIIGFMLAMSGWAL